MSERTRRFAMMLGGNLAIGVGIALLQVSQLGTDPNTAWGMSLAGVAGVDYAVAAICLNCVYFGLEFAFGRHFVGPGTIVNWFGIGPIVSGLSKVIMAVWQPQALPVRLALMAVALITVALGVSLYQTAALGTSPYDSLSLILAERLPIPYFWCRMITDCLSTLGAVVLGGLVSVGTLAAVFATGPFVAFFNTHVSEPIWKPEP